MQFGQSSTDFPLTVKLGEKTPSWGLSRWGGHEGLRFVLPDDEGFSLRGDRRRLFYKGRRRSHRFTILGDTAFEYDCILEREPESNVITLVMEGAEDFDFFRQPDFVEEPFLKGSYAVYKKETLLGEGTGKLCHIHRPEIIDARGRRCWGELSVTGNRLCITIPETWLGEAKYPVIVDPTIGTATVGSQTPVQYTTDYNNIRIIYQYAVNRFFIQEQLAGNCTAHIYLNENPFDKGSVFPLLFDDINGTPKYRRSENEEWIFTRNFNDPPRWKDFSFSVIDSVQGGSYIWFGAYAEGFVTNFDFGGLYYKTYPDQEEINEDEVYDLPDFPINSYLKVYDYILSWYFDYESQSKNYVRTITQGVTLSDTRRQTGIYKRVTVETAGINTILGRFETFHRESIETVFNSTGIDRIPVFLRIAKQQVMAISKKWEIKQFVRICVEGVKAELGIRRIQGFFCNVKEIVSGFDYQESHVIILRKLTETAVITHSAQYWGNYFRGLRINAENTDEVNSIGTYYRRQTDLAQATGTVFRGLLLSVRIVTGLFVRDFLLRRFLVARSELIIKSCITREIMLDSKLN